MSRPHNHTQQHSMLCTDDPRRSAGAVVRGNICPKGVAGGRLEGQPVVRGWILYNVEIDHNRFCAPVFSTHFSAIISHFFPEGFRALPTAPNCWGGLGASSGVAGRLFSATSFPSIRNVLHILSRVRTTPFQQAERANLILRSVPVSTRSFRIPFAGCNMRLWRGGFGASQGAPYRLFLVTSTLSTIHGVQDCNALSFTKHVLPFVGTPAPISLSFRSTPEMPGIHFKLNKSALGGRERERGHLAFPFCATAAAPVLRCLSRTGLLGGESVNTETAVVGSQSWTGELRGTGSGCCFGTHGVRIAGEGFFHRPKGTCHAVRRSVLIESHTAGRHSWLKRFAEVAATVAPHLLFHSVSPMAASP